MATIVTQWTAEEWRADFAEKHGEEEAAKWSLKKWAKYAEKMAAKEAKRVW